MLSIFFLSILLIPHSGDALMPLSVWEGLVPTLIPDQFHPEFIPAFMVSSSCEPSKTVPTVVGQILGLENLRNSKRFQNLEKLSQVVCRLLLLLVFELTFAVQDERQLLREGQALKDQIISLRNKVSSPLPTSENVLEENLRQELKHIHKKLEDMQKQLTERTQPALAEAISDLHSAMEPLDTALSNGNKCIAKSLGAIIFTPSVTTALQGVQALTSFVAMVDILRAARGIQVACSHHNYELLRRAQLHMLRAEGRLVGAGADLDRIASDTMSDRPIQRCDLDRFGIGQRDTAVQLANVRHSLKALRGGDAEDEARTHGKHARRWFVIGVAFAGATRFIPAAGLLPGPLGPVATCTALVAAAVHTVLAGIHGHLAGSVDGVKRRHDAALAEHEGLQAQYDELPCSDGAGSAAAAALEAAAASAGKPASPTRTAATSPTRKTVGWDDADETVVEDCASPGAVERERQRVLDALRELIRDVKRPESQRATSAADRHAEEDAGRSRVGSVDNVDDLERAAGERAPAGLDASPAPPPESVTAPSRLLASTWRPGGGRGDTPRPSGLRQPTATPPPPLRGFRTGRHSLTPAPVMRASVTPGPPAGRLGSMTPAPVGYGQTPPPPAAREGSPPRTPRGAGRTTARRPITPAPTAASRYTPGPACGGDAGPLELPEQLLDTLAHRIEAHALDSPRRHELEGVFGQLREATRAAKQQVPFFALFPTVATAVFHPATHLMV